MPRICFVTTSYPDFPGGYRGGFVRHTALELVRRGYQISVVTPRIFRRSPRAEQNGGETIYRFPFWSEEKLLVHYQRIPIARMATYLLSGLFHTWRIARGRDCRLIHAHFVIPAGLIAVLAGRLLRKPVIVQAYGSDVTKYAGMNSLLRRLTAVTLHHADHIVTVSEPLRTILLEQFAAPPAKITVRSGGVDMTRFRATARQTARQQLGLEDGEAPVILYVGALTTYKGADHLLTAAAILAQQNIDFRLLIIGEGPMRDRFAAQAGELGIADKVRFVGVLPNDAMPRWYNAADLFVLPSLREGTPVSLLEALSCGLPVVVSRAGGMPQVIQDGENGFLVDVADPVALAEKMGLLLGDADLRQKFGRAGRETAVNWGGITEEVDVIEALYRRLGATLPEPEPPV